jgi:hypothetical protein
MTGWLLATFVAAAPSADKPRASKHHPEQIFNPFSTRRRNDLC